MNLRFKEAKPFLLTFLLSLVLIFILFSGEAELLQKTKINLNSKAAWSQYPNPKPPSPQNPEQVKPEVKENPTQNISKLELNPVNTITTYTPRYKIAWAHPTNYGERFTKDINGVAVYNQPIIVLHETAGSALGAIHFFQTPHYDENQQVSYHTLIELDGTVVYIVPPEKRAFGAGNSVFESSNGKESVKTNPKFAPSVNNFAYHISLETPQDGWNNQNPTHSGYTEEQYNTLAWFIAQSNVPENRITTHRQVDRSGNKVDPRSFDFPKFLNLLHTYRGNG
jgi:N-acetylmuramoyl-L-alanine amidase